MWTSVRVRCKYRPCHVVPPVRDVEGSCESLDDRLSPLPDLFFCPIWFLFTHSSNPEDQEWKIGFCLVDPLPAS
jgi:hypothetical protein